MNFIQLVDRYGENDWRVDVGGGLSTAIEGQPPPNPPFYLDRDWRDKNGIGVDDMFIQEDGTYVFWDGATAKAKFYLFIVERCCVKYYKDEKKMRMLRRIKSNGFGTDYVEY